jgi:hypothetical protein
MKKSLTNQRERDEKYGNLSCQILSSGIMLTPSVVNKINVCYMVFHGGQFSAPPQSVHQFGNL